MSEKAPLNALLQLRRGWGGAVGSDRIALLKAIERLGSISAAGSEVDLSFRGAWDAVQALNGLFDHPLVLTKTGGRGGGGAALSPAGRALIEGYERLELQLGAMVADLETAFEADRPQKPERPPSPDEPSGALKTSARNVLSGRVSALRSDAVSCELAIALDHRLALRARITRSSGEALGLRLGAPVKALIKSNFVGLEPAAASARSTTPFELFGVVTRREASAGSLEFLVALDGGAALTATLERPGLEGLQPGARVRATVDPACVIVAVG